MIRMLQTATVILSTAVLAACATANPDVVSRNEAQRLASVSDAVVLTTRPVVVDGSQSGIGGTSGAVIGGVAGSSVGGSRDGVVVGILAAVIGGVIGNAVERSTTREDAVEILVQMRNGERRSIVQARSVDTFQPGDPVILVNSGGKVRVTRAPAVQPSSYAPSKG